MPRFQFVVLGCAAATLLALGSGVAVAHDETAKGTTAPETIIIKISKQKGDGKDAPATPTPPATDGVALIACDDNADKVETENKTTDAKGEVTTSRVIICSKGDKDVAGRLSSARAKIDKNDDLDAAMKAKVLAAIDAQIARAAAR